MIEESLKDPGSRSSSEKNGHDPELHEIAEECDRNPVNIFGEETGNEAGEVIQAIYGIPNSHFDQPLNSLGVIPEGMYAASCDEDRSLRDDVPGGLVEHEGVIFYATTDHGVLRSCDERKPHNDDAYFVIPEQKTIGAADGVSGNPKRNDKGRMAASVATLAALMEAHLDLPMRKLIEIMHGAALKHRLFIRDQWKKQKQKKEKEPPKNLTTSTVARLNNNNVIECASIGNTRALVIRGEKAHRLTYDHTMLNSKMGHMEITEEQAFRIFGPFAIRMKNNLVQALGSDENLHPGEDPDSNIKHVNIKPFYETFQAQGGDVLLICSDGVTDVMTDDEIAEFVYERRQKNMSLAEIIDELKEHVIYLMKYSRNGDHEYPNKHDGDNIVIVGLVVPE
ncbi:PP2C family protein-serine/threonine phosphatase [Patescibacteria group bacterium]